MNKKIIGKTLVLVDSDNPWYLNKDTTIPIPYKKNNLPKIERYEEKKEKKPNTQSQKEQIIYLLLIFIVLLLLYSFFIKK